MNEIITRIWESDKRGIEGYDITTNKRTISLEIDSMQQCCENSGFFMSSDNLKEYIGAKLIEVKVTDKLLNTKKLEELDLKEDPMEELHLMFVNIETSVGVLQFTAYNEHNGYYGHKARVLSTYVDHEEEI